MPGVHKKLQRSRKRRAGSLPLRSVDFNLGPLNLNVRSKMKHQVAQSGVMLLIVVPLLGCVGSQDSSKGHTMTLEVNGKVVLQDLDHEVIRSSLAGVDVDRDGEGFAILSHDKITYVQVSGDPTRGFDAEYQEGDISKHYRAENESFSLDDAANIMTEYLEGDVEWEEYGKWSKITW